MLSGAGFKLSLPTMFDNSEQKLVLNEIYILAGLYNRHKDLVYYLKSCKPKLGGFCTLLTYIQFINPKLLAVQVSPRIISPPSICLNGTLILVICSWAIRPHGSLSPSPISLSSSLLFYCLLSLTYDHQAQWKEAQNPPNTPLLADSHIF